MGTIFTQTLSRYLIPNRNSVYLNKSEKQYQFFTDNGKLFLLDDLKHIEIGSVKTKKKENFIQEITNIMDLYNEDLQKKNSKFEKMNSILGDNAYPIILLGGLKLIYQNIKISYKKEKYLESGMTEFSFNKNIGENILSIFIPKLMKRDSLDVFVSPNPKSESYDVKITYESNYRPIKNVVLFDQPIKSLNDISKFFENKYHFSIYLEDLMNRTVDRLLKNLNKNKLIYENCKEIHLQEPIEFKNYFKGIKENLIADYKVIFNKEDKSSVTITLLYPDSNRIAAYHSIKTLVTDNYMYRFKYLEDSEVVNYYIW